MTEKNNNSVGRFAKLKNARDDALEAGADVDLVNDFILVAEWTAGSYTQTVEIYLDGREGAWAVKSQDGDSKLVKLYDDLDGALERFRDCLKMADKDKSVAYA